MLILALIVAVTTSTSRPAAAQVSRIGGYEATLTNIEARAGMEVKVDLVRWSTDEEREQIVTAFVTRADAPPPPPAETPAEPPAEAAAPADADANASADTPADDDKDDAPEVPLDPEERFLQALRAVPTVGVVWTDESGVGYTLRYAHREPMAGGGERVILIADRRLGSRAFTSWEPSGAEAQAYPYTLIELHLAAGGASEGKLSLSAAIAADQTANTLALENYAAAPVHFDGVTQVP